MCALGAILGVLLFSLTLFSQGNFGRILGTVTDQSGGVISGATVTVLDTQRGVARTLTTLVGGDANDFARCREVFETFSRMVAHMGGVGAGQLDSSREVSG